MVKIAISVVVLAAGAALAHADEATRPSPHAARIPAAATATPADAPPLPAEVRAWFEGAVGNLLSGVDPDDGKTVPAKK